MLALVFTCFAWASEVRLERDTPVYAKPRLDARVLTTLKAGAKAQAGESVDGFRKIFLPGGRTGYMAEDEEVSLPESPEARTRPLILGLFGSYAGLKQGQKSFMTSDQVQYQTSGYNGSALRMGVSIERKYTDWRAYRLFLGYETLQFQGTATEVGIPTQPLQVSLNESFVIVGADLKYYMTASGLWLGFGGEYARGLTVKLSLNGISVPTSDSDLANLLIAGGAAGWDIGIGGWQLTPNIHVGDAPFAHPNILIFQASLGVGHTVSF